MNTPICPVSPITGSFNTKIIQQFSPDFFIQKYQQELKVDISAYFQKVDQISLCHCLDTGYQFFIPFELAGDASLYEKLEHFDWYYQSEKWEFEITFHFLQPGDRLLEIGSGRGDFLDYLRSRQIEGEGLELNPSAIQVCQQRSLNVICERVENFAPRHIGDYDTVVSFQVLEHLTDIKTFLENCLSLLKQGGQLILAVPNNDSYIRYQMPSTNLPPHHMGWWNKDSLAKLSHYFPMALRNIEYETITLKNADSFIWVIENQFLPQSKLVRSLLYRCVHPFFSRYVRDNRDQIIGHTILAVYTKQ